MCECKCVGEVESVCVNLCVFLHVRVCACVCVSVNEGVCEESWAAAVALAMSCDAPSGGVWTQSASALPTLEFSTP